MHHYVPVIVLWNYLQIGFKRHHLVARVGYCYQVSAVTISVNVVSLVGQEEPLSPYEVYKSIVVYFCCILLWFSCANDLLSAK